MFLRLIRGSQCIPYSRETPPQPTLINYTCLTVTATYRSVPRLLFSQIIHDGMYITTRNTEHW